MKSVICFGEALIDFLNINDETNDPNSPKTYHQYPGGAPANAAVAVAKLGGKSLFAGQVGNDVFGHFLQDSLEKYGVDTRFLEKHHTAKTALAFVTLDTEGDRSFSFYRHETADVLFKPQQVKEEWFVDQPIFHYCSNTLTSKGIAASTRFSVEMARANKALVSFDVNLRHNLWPDGRAHINGVNEQVIASDIIKFSKDELEYLADGNSRQYVDKILQNGPSLLVITDGDKAIEYFGNGFTGVVEVPNVKAVDTTAGGDAFSGALLFSLSQLQDPFATLKDTMLLPALLKFAAACGGHTVTRPGAFPALPEFDDVKTDWPKGL
jgi:fructokinase